ncbi:MAG: tetratricopeptide repeat protein [Lachnospiraceae bacterium]|uniref:Tetratricopeptide repeat protein n=1 Tax=Candidatus Weimeria bifida TaxID=2599074 RepID=A0A6N7IYW2_9FIRM|nr:tetratricopeptide repeat protein [Candidatus Weimeria bifida]RRF95108.1 MAG: tetratricopeptide repeat protein [Lachnospiraceae bacterium]
MNEEQIQKFKDTLEETEKLYNDRKLDEAQKLVSDFIDTFTDDFPVKEDDEYLYFDFKTAIEEAIYVNEELPKKKMRPIGVPVSNVYVISGSIALEQGDYSTALERLEEAMDWNPISPDIAFEYAEAVRMMGSLDQYLDLTKRIFPHIYMGVQMAQAYRNIAYYYEQKGEKRKAIESLLYSLIYDENNKDVENEINEISEGLSEEEKTINMAEFPDICKNDGIPFGPDQLVLKIAYASARHFEKVEPDPRKSYYYYYIMYELTRDDKMKEKAEQQRKRAQH